MRIVAVLIFVLVCTGAINIIRAQWQVRRTGAVINKTVTQISYIVFWVATSTLLLLVTGYFTPLQILMALVFSLLIPCFAALLSTVLFANRRKPPYAVARDRLTGEQLGFVIGQVNEGTSAKIAAYKIRTNNGEILERSTETIVIGN